MVYPKYIEAFLKPRHSVYNTNRSLADSVGTKVPQSVPLAHKSPKQFGLSVAYDAPNDLKLFAR